MDVHKNTYGNCYGIDRVILLNSTGLSYVKYCRWIQAGDEKDAIDCINDRLERAKQNVRDVLAI